VRVAALTPVGPYALAHSAGGLHDPSRSFSGGVLTLRLHHAGGPAEVRVRQRRDGAIELATAAAGPLEPLVDHVRFLLGLDDDHGPFLDLARADPLLREVAVRRRGMRPLRTSTVAHALLKAVCGQLITSREAIAIERRIVRALAGGGGGPLPPTREGLLRLGPARLAACGLASRRAAALTGLLRELDPERLHGQPTASAVARIVRAPGLGPWSAGVVALHGLGRYDHGLVGDLGLVELLSALRGRRVEAHETAELLEPYGPYAGLASVYLLAAPPPVPTWKRPRA
jgi:AraC family transcriptional regulator of adaptative response / DNA-3-methyladenine glycosylase II